MNYWLISDTHFGHTNLDKWGQRSGNSTWNIHGHTHGKIHHSEEYVSWYSKDYHIDISPELVGFKPLRLDLLLKNYN